MRRKVETDCPQDCPDRSATCHATCEKYIAAWNQRREEENGPRFVVGDYCFQMIELTKKRGCRPLSKYRPNRR